MIPSLGKEFQTLKSVPRTRGDDPGLLLANGGINLCSPHTRG